MGCGTVSGGGWSRRSSSQPASIGQVLSNALLLLMFVPLAEKL
jgi:hypothetical protein